MSKTILLADDDPDTLKVVIHYFKEYSKNYEVFHAPNGKVACEVAGKKLPDLIIMDWDMPIMNGIQATTYLKLQSETQHIPIVIATGRMVKDHHLREAFESGAVDYIRKPLNPIELLARVNSAMVISDSVKKIQEQKNDIEAKNQDLTKLYQKEKELLKSIIDHKARELSAITMQLAQKNELLNNIKLGLQQPSTSNNVKGIIKTIDGHLDNSNNWVKFKIHFTSVHPNFFGVLEARYPQLTENELRLCAYIKMRLSSKEIANLINLSVKGMESARYRLKKRFRLGAKDDLNQFIAGV